MQFTNRITSITQDKILPVVVDNVLNSNVLALRLLGNASKWVGETLKRPIKHQKSSTGGSFSGLDTFSTSTSETRLIASFDVRGVYQSIVIPGIEKSVNATEARVMDLVKVEMESGMQDLTDSVGTFLYGDGTGNSSKDPLGLGAVVDDGTDVTTFGNISRTTYTIWKATRTASGGTLTLDLLAALHSNVSAGSSGRQSPTLDVTTETVWDLYESLLTPTVRANYESYGYPVVTRTSKGAIRQDALKGTQGSLKGTQGFSALTFRGVPVVADEKATSQVWFALNENYLDWYGLKGADLEPINLGSGQVDSVYSEVPSKNHGFGWTGFKKPTNQYGEVGQIILLGNLVSFQPRRHGKLTGISSV